MKTTTILKSLALALLMPTMLLTAACSNSDDIANTEKPANTKGYALPATVNVTRQGDDATRATYNESTRKLSFSTGDKLFVMGAYDGYQKRFAGLLTWQSGGTFSGTILTETEYSGTAAERLASADISVGLLMPAGYTDYGYLSIDNEGAYDAVLNENYSKAFALTKKEAVEQFSRESAEYVNGFALAPENAILNFTISGLAANTEVAVCFKDTEDEDATPVNVTTNAEGVATFAVGMDKNKLFESYSLTVDGTAIALPADIILDAGTIYNISRKITDLSTLTADYEAKNGETLTGTLANNVKISIADGATVTLKDVTINGGNSSSRKLPGIQCNGNATITLVGSNTVNASSTGNLWTDADYAGIQVGPSGTTLTIQGDGSLSATGQNGSAGIGGSYAVESAGNIIIASGTINATGGDSGAGIGGAWLKTFGTITISGGDVTAVSGDYYAAGIGTGYCGTCGNITISGGTVTATGDKWAAGIGSGGDDSTCGNILISGGTVTATGGSDAAGIGGGYAGADCTNSCGNITITSGVTHVTATKGESNEDNSSEPVSIGAGGHRNGGWDEGLEEDVEAGENICGTVNIEAGANVIQN